MSATVVTISAALYLSDVVVSSLPTNDNGPGKVEGLSLPGFPILVSAPPPHAESDHLVRSLILFCFPAEVSRICLNYRGLLQTNSILTEEASGMLAMPEGLLRIAA